MSDTIRLLQERRSVAPHLMTGPGPTVAELDTILAIASRVPDHGKLCPWRFIVIAGEARQRIGAAAAALALADQPDIDPKRREIEETRFTRAPVVVGVVSRAGAHPKIPVWEQELSAGASAMLLCVAANAMGFATAWLTEWMAYDRRVLALLGVAESERMAGFVHIGHGAKPNDRPRPPLSDIVTRWNG
ncbi:MAG: nitroreductase family protein [Alsobacter sp.]